MLNPRAIDASGPAATPARPAVAAPRRAVRSTAQGIFARPQAPLFAAGLVVVLVVASISNARSAGLVAALWGAGGLAVACWLRSGRGLAHDLAFGALMAVAFCIGNLLAGNSTGIALMFTTANMIEVGCAVFMARRFAPTLNLNSVTGAARFLLAAAVVAPIPAGLFAAAGLVELRGQDFLEAFQTWWFGHAMGIAVIAPFGLALTKKHLSVLRQPLRVVECAVLLGLTGAATWLVFAHWQVPASFAVTPLLILVATRLRILGITAALVVVTIVSVGATLHGLGPMAATPGMSLAQQVLMAQLFVLMGCLPTLLVASLLEERDRLSARAVAGQERAEKASEGKSRLLANVAHEIKSPVGGIIGIGELWSSGQLGPVSETQAEMSTMLVKTARQVEALAHDLLDVARAEAGAVKVDLRPVDVGGVLDDVRRSIALMPEAVGMKLEVVRMNDGLIAVADSVRLSQVVANLASNAVKYGAAGGQVTFRALRSGPTVRLSVEDSGAGLSLEKQAQLFEPFNRLGLERSTIEGHGVGLAIAKRLVELQGGAIGVESAPGKGATFWIELPAA